MRIADKMNYDQVKSNLSKNRTEMAELQNQAATQKRLNKPSDDPLGTTRVLATRTEINGNTQFLKNINTARSFLEYSDQSLGELSEALMRAKELAISQSSDASADAKTRETTAAEVEQILHQSVQIGNRKLGDRFLFGGFRTTRPPFDVDGNYAGDSGEIKIAINKEASVAMNMPGNAIFSGVGLRERGSEVAPESTNGMGTGGPGPDSREVGEANLRGPASIGVSEKPEAVGITDTWQTSGINVFHVVRDLETSLRTNDKGGIQDSLDRLDEALAQVVLARSKLGSRVMTLNSTMEGLQKGQVDAKTMASNLEDADTFELVSDLNKTESTLKASLATSSKLIQPSLLDFLR